MDSCSTEGLSPSETLKRLSIVPNKYGDYENKRPNFQQLVNPVVIQDAFYVLPKRLLEASMRKLPLSNKRDGALWIGIQSDASQMTQGTLRGTAKQEVISIKGIKMYSRETIEVMAYM